MSAAPFRRLLQAQPECLLRAGLLGPWVAPGPCPAGQPELGVPPRHPVVPRVLLRPLLSWSGWLRLAKMSLQGARRSCVAPGHALGLVDPRGGAGPQPCLSREAAGSFVPSLSLLVKSLESSASGQRCWLAAKWQEVAKGTFPVAEKRIGDWIFGWGGEREMRSESRDRDRVSLEKLDILSSCYDAGS